MGSQPPGRDARPEERAITIPATRASVVPPPQGPDALGAPPPALSAEAARFADEGQVARGGMSSIRRVVDLRLGRRQAMKVLDPTAGKDSRAAQRFVEEARITGSLDHPNIVPIYDLGLASDGAPAFITMKLVQGESFADYLDRLGDARLESESLESLVQILLRVCDALSFAHARGIIHCDIKPANIMVGSHGQVYVMDWGLATTTDKHAATSVRGFAPRPLRPGTVSGTPAYMSPEQANGQVDRIDERTDVFGLGATLYRLLTGDPPYMAETVVATVQKARTGRIMRPDTVVLDERLPPELCRIAMKALAADPDRRYPTIDALKADLERFLRGGGWLPTQAFSEGEEIVREGDIARVAYVIVEGVVEAFKTVNGQKVRLRIMGPGEVFGEASVFSARPRTASVVAKSDVVVRMITGESLERELSHNAPLASLVRALAERFRELDAELTRRVAAERDARQSVPQDVRQSVPQDVRQSVPPRDDSG
jgi:serine/threonine-protein kinase